jgi:DtxR family transcriptional regulator, Mn-dependent transcriptional regulator
MLPSSTVENYLKAIFSGASGLKAPHRLLPMGQLATALGVTPGTATTMVKTLADSGLVEYEPYTGVALTAAGEKLAALVLRRHRLIELFLVRFMGYAWDEVHDEAEQLEHVVSDRLIDRIDEMLGRPEADPHGDPIPNSEGQIKQQDAQSLLTCPLRTPVTVSRVIDQDRVFLRFIEQNNLKPGESIEVEERDPASDSVRVRGKDDRQIVIGTRAASKLLVNIARVLVFLTLGSSAFAQDKPSAGLPAVAPASAKAPAGRSAEAGSNRPWEITDNSFLVEEAFNQEAGVVQNIFGIYRPGDGSWVSAFTQEWPVRVQAHQFSYTVALGSTGNDSGIGDVLLHYRFQAVDETAHRPAFSPRVSLVLPTGNVDRGLGDGSAGWEVNLPFSKQFGDLYLHWNAGFTNLPSAEAGSLKHNLFTPRAAASGIWRVRPMFNLMIETVFEWPEEVAGATTDRSYGTTVLPGFRTGWNVGEAQAIVGVGVPVSFSSGTTDTGVFGYFSYELPFSR